MKLMEFFSTQTWKTDWIMCWERIFVLVTLVSLCWLINFASEWKKNEKNEVMKIIWKSRKKGCEWKKNPTKKLFEWFIWLEIRWFPWQNRQTNLCEPWNCLIETIRSQSIALTRHSSNMQSSVWLARHTNVHFSWYMRIFMNRIDWFVFVIKLSVAYQIGIFINSIDSVVAIIIAC